MRIAMPREAFTCLVLCSIAYLSCADGCLPHSPTIAAQLQHQPQLAATHRIRQPIPWNRDMLNEAMTPLDVGDPGDFNFPQVRLLFASFGLPLSQMQEANFTVAVQETLEQLSGIPENDTSIVFLEWYAVEAMILADSESDANAIANNVSAIDDETFTMTMQANLEDKLTSDGTPFGLLSATQTIAVVPVSGRSPKIDLQDTNDIIEENAGEIVGVILALLTGAGLVSWFLGWGFTVLMFLLAQWLLPEHETKQPENELEATVIELAARPG